MDPSESTADNDNANVRDHMQMNQSVYGEVHSESFIMRANSMEYPCPDTPSGSLPINTSMDTNPRTSTECPDDLMFLLNSPCNPDQETIKRGEEGFSVDDLFTIKPQDLYLFEDLLVLDPEYTKVPITSSSNNAKHSKTLYETEDHRSLDETENSRNLEETENFTTIEETEDSRTIEQTEEISQQRKRNRKNTGADLITPIYRTINENLQQCFDLPIEEELKRLSQPGISDEHIASGIRIILTALWSINLAIDEKKITPELLEIEEFPFKKKYDRMQQKNGLILEATKNTIVDKMGCVSCPEIAKCVCPSCYCIRKCNDCFKKEKCGYVDKEGKICNSQHRLVLSYLGHTPKQHQLTAALIREKYPYTWIQYFAQNPASRESYDNILGDLKQLLNVALTEANKVNKTSNTILIIFLALKAFVHHPKYLTNTWITNKVFCQGPGCDNFATFVQYELNTDQNRTFECKLCTRCAHRRPDEYNSGVIFGEFRHNQKYRPEWKGRPYAAYMRMEERKKIRIGRRPRDISEDKCGKKRKKTKV